MANVMRPDIFTYHDYRKFLKDLISFFKKDGSGFTLKTLARLSGVSGAYLTLVIKGSRPLTDKTLGRILPHLKLNPKEQRYLRQLYIIADSASTEEKFRAMDQVQKLRDYRQLNPNENRIYEYLSRWLHVAIREMAMLPDFKLDPVWIQQKLGPRVLRNEITESIDFLLKNKFIEVSAGGKVKTPDARLECLDQIFRTALAQFHRQVFGLTAQAFDEVDLSQKSITAYTMTFSKARFEEVKKVLQKTLLELVDLSENDKKSDSVYQISLNAFPLTKVNQ